MRQLQDQGIRAYRSGDFAAPERAALVKNGFLQRVTRGWYIASRADEAPGDTTAWYASIRDFLGRYCDVRFGTAWHLSPADSLLVHAGVTALPAQTTIHTTKVTNTVLPLPGGCSLLLYHLPRGVNASTIQRAGPLQIVTLEQALVDVPPAFFRGYPLDAHLALDQLSGTTALNRILLSGGHSTIAGRLAGALRATHRPEMADDVLDAMRAAGYDIREHNPFERPRPIIGGQRTPSPYVARMQLQWHAMREAVLAISPSEPGPPDDPHAYLATAAEAYEADAYHSLSIEGYDVTPALIARVSAGNWKPDHDHRDAGERDALAARGYFLARAEVLRSLGDILRGTNAGTVADRDHQTWYRQLFAPGIQAGIVRVADLAGYRSAPVFIRQSAHVPPPATAAQEMIPALFRLLTDEPSAAVRAILGHFFVGYIHPYPDGNGRMARFLMNAMLASGGYPWTIIPVTRRREYMQALEQASTAGDIQSFAEFVVSCIGVAPHVV